MLVFYSLIIKRQSVISVKLLLSVSFALLMIFVFVQQSSVLFFFKYCCYSHGRSLCGLPAKAREEKNFLAPSLSMIIGLPVTKPNPNRSALVNIRRKALLSSVGFRKRMTSRSPCGSPCDSCKLRFDRPL